MMKPLPLTPTPVSNQTRDPDLLKVGAALQRSARRALEIALQTSTPCYIWQDGRIVNIGAPADPVSATKR